MQRRAFLTTACAAALTACAATPPEQDQTEAALPMPTPALEPSFDVALYRQLAVEPGNQFLSPFSVRSAFALLYPGARGQTAREMAALFPFDSDRDVAATQVANQARALQTGADGPLQIANAAWVQRSFTLEPAYQRTVRETLGSEVETVNFAQESVARARINRWVSDATRERIQDLIPPGFISGATRLVLTNAVYFKATWAHPFDANATTDGQFHAAAGPQPARLMRQTTHARYFETPTFQAAELPYNEGGFALAVFLPREASSLAAFETQLTSEQLDAWLAQVRTAPSARLALTLPQVEMEASYDLIPPLRALGVRTAFTDQADLTGISAAGGLAVSGVVHKTFLKIDEAGTEAAAATGIGVALTAAPIQQPAPIPFRADRPFFIVLRHVESGTILFLGRVTEV